MMKLTARLLWGFLFVALWAGQAAAASLPVQVLKTPQGLDVWFVEDHHTPVIALKFLVRGGQAEDPVGKEGLSSLYASLFDEGAGDWGGTDFQKTLKDQAISLSIVAGRDALLGGVKALRSDRDTAFALLQAALHTPHFAPEALERMRASLIANLRDQESNPAFVAARAYDHLAFAGHPYGRAETVESLSALTREDLQAYVPARITRDRLVLAASGDLSADEVMAVIDQLFSDLPATGAPRLSGQISPQGAGQVLVIPRDQPQSLLLFASGGPARNDPDWIPTALLNYALGGGGFASRLMQEVREKRGLTYGISTDLDPQDLAPLWQGQAATRNDKAGEAIALIRAEWGKVRDQGISAAERQAAADYLVGAWPLTLTSTAAIADTLIQLQKDHLPPDYFDRREKLIRGVTDADIRRVAARFLDPAALTWVVVGQPVGVVSSPATSEPESR
jgi:zinc protease